MVLRSGLLRGVLHCAVLFLLVMSPVLLRASTPPVPSSPPERVVDLANIIEPALEGQLVTALRELEEKTTAQMVILTVASLDGEAIEPFSLHVFEQWKLGQKGKDNGLLLTVALKERKYRFEAGYGLESVLPDSLLGSLGREKMVPFFKAGKYGEGIAAATKQIIAILAPSEQPVSQAQPDIGARLAKYRNMPPAQQSEWILKLIDCMLYFIPVLMVVLFIMAFVKAMQESRSGRRTSSHRDSSSWSSSDSDSSSSWSSSDSSSSSSSSDFSGGGGESGGGGASGSW